MGNSGFLVEGLHEVYVKEEGVTEPLSLRSMDLFPAITPKRTSLVHTNKYGDILLHFDDRLTKSLVKSMRQKLEEEYGYVWDNKTDRWIRCHGLVRGKTKKFIFIFSTKQNVSSVYELSPKEDQEVTEAIAKLARSRNPNRYLLYTRIRRHEQN